MSQTPITVDSSTTPKLPTPKEIAKAFAPIAISLAAGIGFGMLIEKIKNKGTDTTESA
jgi:hypothetical protein